MRSVFLKEVCDVFCDGDWIESKDQSDSGIRLIQTGNVGVGVFKDRIEKARWISEDTFKKLRCTEILEGDVLVSRLPDPVGRSCLIPALAHKAITAVDCSIVRFDPKRINAKFFIYYSQSSEYAKAIAPLISGSTRQRISRENLGAIKIPLPSLDEQLNIVKKLDGAFAEIELFEKNLELSDEMLEQLFQSILSTAFKQSQTFLEQSESSVKEISAVKLMKLADICKLVGGGTPSKANSEYYSGKIPWATVRDMRSRWLEDTEHKINEIAVRESSTNVIPAGNVVLASRVGLGKVIQLKQDTAINQDLRALIPKENSKIDSDYLYYWTLSITPEIIAAGKGATVQGVTLPFLENLVVPLPSLETQSEIVEKLDSAFAEIETLKAQTKIEKDYVVALRKSFLSNAFSLDEAVA